MHQFLKDFAVDMLRQLFGWSKPRQGKLMLTRHALNKMHEYQLSEATLRDVFTYGDEDTNGRIIRHYAEYSVGLYFKVDEPSGKFVIITCWKGGR
jgi:hypothetical protein